MRTKRLKTVGGCKHHKGERFDKVIVINFKRQFSVGFVYFAGTMYTN